MNASITALPLVRTLADRYGAGTGIFDPTPIGWAAEYLLGQGMDPSEVQDNLKKVERVRRRLALPCVPVFVHNGKIRWM